MIWQIGESDNNCQEFALAPKDYNKFLEKDFGWEDGFFVIGHSDVKKDFPYVLPGAIDYWGGTSGLSGIRPHQLNLLFGIEEKPEWGDWKLVIDILECSPEKPPLFKVTVNGESWKFQLKKGMNPKALKGINDNAVEQKLEIPIDSKLIRNGGNEIQLTSLDGSWLVFDQIRMEAPIEASLIKIENVFIRGITPADYELIIGDVRIQPLLVEVQHLDGISEISVQLDDNEIFNKTIEHGRSIFEAPMAAVDSSRQSNYKILVDGKIVQEGIVERGPKKVNRLVDYVDTKIGSGHSRWMIAPGPWMPFGMVKISPDNQNEGWQAGYQPTFESIGTFSHIHEWTMAGLGVFPTNGPLVTEMGKQGEPDSGYRSNIDKSSEKTPLGYYSIMLSDYNIQAELTATTRCSFQRYTFPKDIVDSRVLVDLKIPAEYGYKIEEAFFKKVSDTRIEGFSKQSSLSVWGEQYYRKQMVDDGDRKREWDEIAQEYTIHFVMEFDRPHKKVRHMGR